MTTLTNRIAKPASLACLALMAAWVFAACGGGGGGLPLPATTTPANTGNVSLSIKDVPLSQLSTFTIDISNATLKGAGNADAVIFPAPSSPANSSVTVDLLAAQAFNVLLGSTTVPVGHYYAIELTYANPAATSTANVAQTVQHQGNLLTGMFSPGLIVTTGSSQSIQVDVDLQHSVIDLGNDTILLAPVIKVDVLNQAVGVNGFPGQVKAVNVPADKFTVDIVHFSSRPGQNSPQGGAIDVQCSSTTTFNDGNGNITTGGVAAKVVIGDALKIDGSLLNNVITATAVARMPNTLPGMGFPNASGMMGPPVTDIGGTIMSLSPAAGTMTVKVQYIYGPGTNYPAQGTDVTVSVGSSTTLHRGGQTQLLSDFKPGNHAEIYADQTATGYDALDIDEGPAYVTANVISVSVGTGANGDDVLTFSVVTVDQIPAAQLTFLPATLTCDIPTGLGLQVNGSVGLVGFFTGTSVFENLSKGGPGNGGPGGGIGFPQPPVIMPPATFYESGEHTANDTATASASGIAFKLDAYVYTASGGNGGGTIGGPGAPSTVTLDVTVTPGATLTKYDGNGNTTTLTAAQAVTAINANIYFIGVEGSAAGTATTFTADIGLTLIDKSAGGPGGGIGPAPGFAESGDTLTTPAAVVNASGDLVFSMQSMRQGGPATVVVTVPAATPITKYDINAATTITAAQAATLINAAPVFAEAWGSVAGTAGAFTADVQLDLYLSSSLPGPFPGPSFDYLNGTISGTATLNAAGEITFTLAVAPNQGITGNVVVTVSANALLTLVDQTAIINLPPSGGGLGGPPKPAPLTTAQALAALNAPNIGIAVEGTLNASAHTFACTVELVIIK